MFGFDGKRWLVWALVLCVGGTMALAQEGKGKGKGAERREKAAASDATTQPGNGEKGREHRGMQGPAGAIHAALADLNLSVEQKEKIRAILEETRPKQQSWMEEHKEEMQQLQKEMQAAREAKDREKMREVMAKRKALWESSPMISTAVPAVKAVLTDEQRAAFEAKMDARRAEMRERARDGEKPRERREGKGREKNKDAGAADKGE